MKRHPLLTLVLLVPLVIACSAVPGIGDLIPISGEEIQGSGNLVTREFDLSGFDKVDVSHATRVNISPGDTFSVVVTIDDNVEEYLRVEKQGSTLKIGLDLRREYRDTHATAEVTMPELTGLELSGGTRGTSGGFKASKGLNVDVSGGSRLSGDIDGTPDINR